MLINVEILEIFYPSDTILKRFIGKLKGSFEVLLSLKSSQIRYTYSNITQTDTKNKLIESKQLNEEVVWN